MTKKTTEEESWNRYPEARVRMREDSLQSLVDGLGEDGVCIGDAPRFHFLDDGIFITMSLNVGKFGDVVAFPLDIFIPVDIPEPPKKKVKGKAIVEAPKFDAIAVIAAEPIKVEE
jgi:hypothetical protein